MKINYYQVPLQQIKAVVSRQTKPSTQFSKISPIKYEIDHPELYHEYPDQLKIITEPSPSKSKGPQFSQIIQHSHQYQFNRNLSQSHSYSNVSPSYLKNPKQISEDNLRYDEILKRQERSTKKVMPLETTFKPRDIHKNLSYSQEPQDIKQVRKKFPSGSKYKRTEMEGYLMGDAPVVAKTKYQKLLEKHLQENKKFNSSRKSSGINTTKKLGQYTPKQNHSKSQRSPEKSLNTHGPNINKSIVKNEKTMHKSKSATGMKQPHHTNYSQLIKNFDSIYNSDAHIPKNVSNQSKSLSRATAQGKNGNNYPLRYSNSKKKMNGKQKKSEKWVAMDFYERQMKLIENRKKKQKKGKEEKEAKEINSCTFQPQINNKKNAHYDRPGNPNSYLQQYFCKVNRKY